MTTLILMRHAHVEGIHPERFRGRAEIPLTSLGGRQAQALAERLAIRYAGHRPVALYTSPMGRCIATAATISRFMNVPSQTLLNLHVIDYGEWQGVSHEAALQKWPRLYKT